MAKNQIKISIIRGAFLNPFELQNYSPLQDKYNIQAVSSLYPLNDNIDIPLIKLPSLTDLPQFPFKYQIINRLTTDIHYLFGLDKVVTSSEVVHVAETYYHYTKQAIDLKRQGKIKKIVSTVWEVIPHNNETIRGRTAFKKLAFKYIDHFLAVTKLAKKSLMTEGVPSHKITVIPMGVNLKKFSHKAKKRSNKTTQILFVGRLTSEKGVPELLQSYRNLLHQGLKVHLTVVGKGDVKLPSGLPLTHSTLPYSRIQEAYQKADIFCLPSKTTKYWQEQFGMVLVEAMASGLPIVTTNTGAIKEVCGNAALYAKPSDAISLTNKLHLLVTNPLLRKKFSQLALKRAKSRYDHLKVAKQIDHLYQKVLKS